VTRGEHISFRTGEEVSLSIDYAIVGSGPGGSAAAAILSRAGFTVALCEAGAWRDTEHMPASLYGSMRDLFSDFGQLMSSGPAMIPVVQATCVGGTGVINSAIVVRTPESVLDTWARDHGLGDFLTPAAMDRAQSEIEAELDVAAMQGKQLGRHNHLLLAALQQSGREAHATRRNAAKCRGSGSCLQGCPTGAKRTGNLTWVPEVLTRGGWVLSCAPVSQVLFEGRQASGVLGRFSHPRRDYRGPRGARFRVSARRGVLIAASATGSAPLLARSGVRLAALGTGFRAHPGSGIIGVYPDRVNPLCGTTQGVSSLHHKDDLGIKLESLSLPLDLLPGRIAGAGPTLARTLARANHTAMWIAAVNADAVGTVTPARLPTFRGGPFGRNIVRYQPLVSDTARLRQGCAILARLHFEAGASSVLPGIHGLPTELSRDEIHLIDEAPLNNRAWTWILSHLFGTCALGSDPTRSVVGPDLHVHGYRNLHVVDASCLPTTLGVNPQHTIQAVARLTAERLANA
jgi:choline dehydrogenase-like flavoprotein